MNVKLILAPTLEPVTTSEVKSHLRVDIADEDVLIGEIIDAAIGQVEDITRRVLMTQTWDYFLDGWPKGNSIVLPFGNLQSVTSVIWKDDDGTETTLAATTDYLVETNGEAHGRIVLPYGVPWPSGTLYPSNPITVRFICGWTAASFVPVKIKQAIKMICADLYENRGERIVGQTSIENKTAEYLLASNRLWGNF